MIEKVGLFIADAETVTEFERVDSIEAGNAKIKEYIRQESKFYPDAWDLYVLVEISADGSKTILS